MRPKNSGRVVHLAPCGPVHFLAGSLENVVHLSKECTQVTKPVHGMIISVNITLSSPAESGCEDPELGASRAGCAKLLQETVVVAVQRG